MFDDEEGVAELPVHALDVAGEVLEQRPVDAGGDLVEQHRLGVDHHRAAEFEQLLLAAGQVAGEFVAHRVEAEEVDHLAGLLAHFRLHAPHGARLEPDVEQGLARLAGGNHHQVLDGGQVGELAGDLEGAQQAAVEQIVRRQAGHVLAVEDDAPAVGHERAGDGVEQRRLAGAVGADQAGHRSAGNAQRAARNRLYAAKRLGDGHGFDEHIGCHVCAHCRRPICWCLRHTLGLNSPFAPFGLD